MPLLVGQQNDTATLQRQHLIKALNVPSLLGKACLSLSARSDTSTPHQSDSKAHTF